MTRRELFTLAAVGTLTPTFSAVKTGPYFVTRHGKVRLEPWQWDELILQGPGGGGGSGLRGQCFTLPLRPTLAQSRSKRF